MWKDKMPCKKLENLLACCTWPGREEWSPCARARNSTYLQPYTPHRRAASASRSFLSLSAWSRHRHSPAQVSCWKTYLRPERGAWKGHRCGDCWSLRKTSPLEIGDERRDRDWDWEGVGNGYMEAEEAEGGKESVTALGVWALSSPMNVSVFVFAFFAAG